ncbi:MAG: LacI family DNA-binding transcriptional regulator [Methylobacteriaceae bacterium]|nr:LacI family DNA-binding transcriptional regulator [Methylobacteriaceae bacterium]
MINRRARARPPSLADIAAAAGVSAATVSRIVNGELGRAAPETVERVQRIVVERGYRPNHAGRSLRRRESQIVAMLAPNLDNPAMAAIAASTEAALRDAGHVMILCDTHDRPALQDEYLEAMRAQLARGYVLVSATASPGLRAAMARDEPLVFVNRRNMLGAGAFVGIDNRKAGAEAADHFARLGIDDLAVLHPTLMTMTVADRVEGFLERCAALGIEGARVRRASGEGATHLDIGYQAIRALAAAGGWPKGVFCPSDLIAYAVYRLATEQGLSIPDDCCVVGVDDNQFNAWIAPWLTSIAIPYPRFGAAVVEQLTARWAGAPARDLILPHELIVRRLPGGRG